MSPAAACKAGGITGCVATMRRASVKMLAVGQHAAPAAALAARREYIAALQFVSKGNENLLGRRLFNKDELDLFAAAITKYATRGFGRDEQARSHTHARARTWTRTRTRTRPRCTWTRPRVRAVRDGCMRVCACVCAPCARARARALVQA